MLFTLLISVCGLIAAFIGSIYLSVRVFAHIKSLHDITGTKINAQLKTIATLYENEQNASKTVKEIIEFLNLVFTDFETAQTDTTRRSYIGMAFLVAGTLLQGIAIVIVILS